MAEVVVKETAERELKMRTGSLYLALGAGRQLAVREGESPFPDFLCVTS